MTTLSARLDRLVQRLPTAYPGPGGAIAIVRRGEVLVRHAWGFANAERRVPFTPRTLFRVCSITKQFTCATLLQVCPDPGVLDAALKARLPRLQGPHPTVVQLAHNQSGLRDYWAVAMLLGAGAEDPFGDSEAARVIGATRSLQFAPGTRNSYCNQNFRLISDLVQDHAGRDFAELLRTRVLAPAGMNAILTADTRVMPDGTEGYEGSQGTGFRPAVNRIVWTGDAGLGASLDDIIAWERHIDATRDDPASIYARLSGPVTFGDGASAGYGFGLGRFEEFGRALTGHGGALRGWRSRRVHDAAERLSVVVLFNHMGDAHTAGSEALAAVYDLPMPKPDASLTAPSWLGAYTEPETGLSARVELPAPGEIRLRFGQVPERLLLRQDGSASSERVTLRQAADGLWLDRPVENLRTRLVPARGDAAPGIAGHYRCGELDATLTVVQSGGAHYGAFSGPLGPGRMELLDAIGPDLWALPCPRALDHSPPGDWTLAFRRDAAGRVGGATVGCWLARGLDYARDA